MKKLTKIKLINWHLYNDIEIDIKNNTVICGENGVGKSTLIDAILYIISGGTAKFNTAANEKNDRTIETYVKGKLGYESKEYLRPGDVISHVALEFFDDYRNEYRVLGSVITANVGSRIEKVFYNITKSHIISNNYYSFKDKKKYPATFDELKRNYGEKVEVDLLDGNIEQIKNKILRVLDIDKDDKYLELLPKALAFKPIAEINKFVFDYLLPKKDLNLDNMKESIRRMREFQSIIDLENEKLSYLNKIKEEGLTYESLKKDNLYIDLIKKERDLDKNKSDLNELNKELNNLNFKLNNIKNLIEQNENIIKTNEISIEKINSNEAFDVIRDLKNEKSNIEKEISHLEKENQIIAGIIEELYLDIKNISLTSSIKEAFYKNNYNIYKEEIFTLKNENNQIYNSFLEDRSKQRDNLQKVNDKITNLETELNKLEQGINEPDSKVILLTNILKDYFYNKYNKNVDINPFYDLVEVKDEKWRNALEGYLNSRRGYLFIDKEYYDEALKVYEENSLKNPNLYGVGLVNVNSLDKNIEINENSLASKLEYLSEDAKNYGIYVLNNIICVDKIEDLKLYEGSITSTCMLYQGKVARKINPRFYAISYLGRSSIQLNINRLNKELNKILPDKEYYEDEINKLTKYIDSSSRIKEFLTKIDFNDDKFQILKNNYAKLDKINNEIQKLNNSDLIDLTNDINLKEKENNELKEKNKELKNEYDLLNRKYGANEERKPRLENIIFETESNLSIYKYDEYFKNIKIKYKDTTDSDLDYLINEKNNNLMTKTNIILKIMKDYVSNQQFKCDLNIDINNLNNFIKIASDIEKRELIKYKDNIKKSNEEVDNAFKNDYLHIIRENIEKEKEKIANLNKSLKEKPFGSEKEIYEFKIMPSKNELLKKYYDLFMSDEDYLFNGNSIFSKEMSESNKDLINDLFDKLNNSDNDISGEKELEKFTDYRNFMSYDIKITDKNGNITYYSTSGKGKSGGETQTPFYVFIAASFEQIISKSNINNRRSPASLVFLDEAFNNMDDSRIQTMMDFYKELNIQLLISVPSQRAGSILKYCDTGLSIIKKDNTANVFKINKVDIE